MIHPTVLILLIWFCLHTEQGMYVYLLSPSQNIMVPSGIDTNIHVLLCNACVLKFVLDRVY